MLGVIHYLHTQGVAHRDLKLDNFLLDAEFNLKLIDYGMAAPTEGRDGSGLLRTVLGTRGFQAPEVINLSIESYRGCIVDLFALGVILFYMYKRAAPFSEARPDDPRYRFIAQNRTDIFWASHDQGGVEDPDDFKALLNQMFQLNPNQRPTLPEIVDSDWNTGQVATHEQVIAAMELRHPNHD